MLNIEKLGQVFSTDLVVEKLLSLRRNLGSVLEPSCGNGAILHKLEKEKNKVVGIEIDSTQSPFDALNIDFFDYSFDNTFDSIIGNPPYVRYQDILEETKVKLDLSLFDKRSNLYLFFIYKCIQHLNDKGELIFVVPREFLKSTSSLHLNNFIFNTGTITDIIDLGDSIVFDSATPNCIIFRFEKGNLSHLCNYNGEIRYFRNNNGQLLFLKNDYVIKFSDLFYVKVGGTSAANSIFENKNGNVDFVCSYTQKTGKTKKMYYNIYNDALLPYKSELLNRKIRKFDESNWYMWGRNCYESDKERIYVNYKTRRQNPFFYHDCKFYDGSIFGIFPKFEIDKLELVNIIDKLNKVDWYELGFLCEDRYCFSPISLENTYLPNTFEKYLKSRN